MEVPSRTSKGASFALFGAIAFSMIFAVAAAPRTETIAAAIPFSFWKSGASPTPTATPAGDPTSIANLVAWWKADAITGLSDGNTVSTWTDSSGNGHTLAADGAASVYKVNILNSLPAVRLPSTNGGLSVSLTVSSPFTVLVVYDAHNATGTHRAVQGSNNWLLGAYLGTHQLYNNAFISGPSVVANVFVKSIARTDGTGTEFRVNGSVVGTNAQTLGPGTLFALGYTAGTTSAEPLDGDIVEVAVYSRKLNSTECGTLESYIASKYGF